MIWSSLSNAISLQAQPSDNPISELMPPSITHRFADLPISQQAISWNLPISVVRSLHTTQISAMPASTARRTSADRHLAKRSICMGTQFKKNVYFESSKVNTLNLTKARYEWLFLHWECINHLEFDDAAYQTLINNYKRLQWQKDSSDCRFTYLNAIRQAAPANYHSWIINALRMIVARTNSSNLSVQAYKGTT